MLELLSVSPSVLPRAVLLALTPVFSPETHPRGKPGPAAPLRKSPEFPKNKKDFRNHIDISKLL